MNIVLVTEFFPRNQKLQFTGGVEARTYFLHNQLKSKHNIKVISRSAVAITATPLSIFTRLFFVINAVIKGFKFNPQVVEGSNFVSYLPAFIIAKLKKAKAVAWYPDVFIGSWEKKFGLIGKLGEWMERITLKLPWDHFIALSHQTKKKLVNFGVPANRVTVVYAGVDKQYIAKVKAKKQKQPTICAINRLVPYKRVQDLIKALPQIKLKFPKLQLIVIGSGTEENSLKKLAKHLQVKDSITWEKNFSRIKLFKILKSCHLLCLPSVVEGFGLVTLEALASGVPYVNADIPVNQEITRGSQGGLLFKAKDNRDLANAVIRLLSEKALYNYKLKQAKELLKYYSWAKSARQTEVVYKKTLHPHR